MSYSTLTMVVKLFISVAVLQLNLVARSTWPQLSLTPLRSIRNQSEWYCSSNLERSASKNRTVAAWGNLEKYWTLSGLLEIWLKEKVCFCFSRFFNFLFSSLSMSFSISSTTRLLDVLGVCAVTMLAACSWSISSSSPLVGVLLCLFLAFRAMA